MVTRNAYCLIVLCEDLNHGTSFISVDDLAFVPFEISLGDEDCLPDGLEIFDLPVEFVQDKASLLLVTDLVLVTLVYESESCIDHLMRLDGQESVRVSQHVHIGTVPESDEQLVLEDCPDLS